MILGWRHPEGIYNDSDSISLEPAAIQYFRLRTVETILFQLYWIIVYELIHLGYESLQNTIVGWEDTSPRFKFQVRHDFNRSGSNCIELYKPFFRWAPPIDIQRRSRVILFEILEWSQSIVIQLWWIVHAFLESMPLLFEISAGLCGNASHLIRVLHPKCWSNQSSFNWIIIFTASTPFSSKVYRSSYGSFSLLKFLARK